MSDEKTPGWNIGDPQKFMDDYNAKAKLSNYPPDKKVNIQGLMFEGSTTPGQDNVSVQGFDPEGKMWTVVMDLPNAMYLMNLLHQVWKSTQAPVPSEAPNPGQHK